MDEPLAAAVDAILRAIALVEHAGTQDEAILLAEPTQAVLTALVGLLRGYADTSTGLSLADYLADYRAWVLRQLQGPLTAS